MYVLGNMKVIFILCIFNRLFGTDVNFEKKTQNASHWSAQTGKHKIFAKKECRITVQFKRGYLKAGTNMREEVSSKDNWI